MMVKNTFHFMESQQENCSIFQAIDCRFTVEMLNFATNPENNIAGETVEKVPK